MKIDRFNLAKRKSIQKVSKSRKISKASEFAVVWTILLSLYSFNSNAQKTEIDTLLTRKKIVLGSEIFVSTATLIGLNELWYKDYPRSSFHFFNDNHEWLQMDKVGHMMTSYYIGHMNTEVFEWAGIPRRKALWTGVASGLIYLSAVEMLDGFSDQWGFSWGDMGANILGSSLMIGQELCWNEQRISLKFSYSNSGYAMFNSAQLGRNFQQRVLKDYNGQTYWASFNIHSFLASGAAFPKWVNVAIGYGAREMINAEMNDHSVNNFQPTREFYLSFDADLNRVRWPKTWMKKTAKVLSFIKLPTPTLEVRGDGTVKVHAVFF